MEEIINLNGVFFFVFWEVHMLLERRNHGTQFIELLFGDVFLL